MSADPIRTEFASLMRSLGFKVRGGAAEREVGSLTQFMSIQKSTSSTAANPRFYCNAGVSSNCFADMISRAGVQWSTFAQLTWRIRSEHSEDWHAEESPPPWLPQELARRVSEESDFLSEIRTDGNMLKLLQKRGRGSLSDASRAALETGLLFCVGGLDGQRQAVRELGRFCASTPALLPRLIHGEMVRMLGERGLPLDDE